MNNYDLSAVTSEGKSHPLYWQFGQLCGFIYGIFSIGTTHSLG